VSVGGIQARALRARILKTGQEIPFTQTATTLRLTGLPQEPPDSPITVLEVECDRPPVVDHHAIRSLWKRYDPGMSDG
jgi:alpha-L-fucosidase